MAHMVGIAGSLRKASYNRALLNAAASVVPENSSFEVLSIDDVPLFNQDVEAEFGLPDSIVRLRKQIAAADGIVMSTPEYNAGVPGVLKNAIDWLSRWVEGENSILSGKPIALMGATPGGLGTALAQSAWLPTLRSLRMSLWTGGGMYNLSRAGDEFSDGKISDKKLQQLREFIASFAEHNDAA